MSNPTNARPLPQIRYEVVIRGRAVCMPDGWGNFLAVPESHVTLHTSDPSHAQAYPQYGTRIVYANTDPDGNFRIGSPNHPPSVKNETLYLEIEIQGTGKKYLPPRKQFGLLQKPKVTPPNGNTWGTAYEYDVGTIQTPWPADPPVICGFNGRAFKYPAEFALVLAPGAQPTRGSVSLELLRFSGGQPDAYPEYDDLFKTLERESTNRSTVITSKLAKELIPVLAINLQKVRRPNDVFRIALETFSKPRFNLLDERAFKRIELGVAVLKAFGGRQAYFRGFEGRTTFCALMYAASAVESGLKVSSKFDTTGNSYVTSLVVS